MNRYLSVLLLLAVVTGVTSPVAGQQSTPTETPAATPEENQTDVQTEEESEVLTPEDSEVLTPDSEDSDPPIDSDTNVSFNFSGFLDGILPSQDGSDSLDKGIISYQEAEGEGYSTIYDWGQTRVVDVRFEPDSDTAVFVFYLIEGSDTVAITESVEGSGVIRQTQAELENGSGLYSVRADIKHVDGIFGGYQCGSVATAKGQINLHKECQGTGLGPLIPDAPSLFQILIGSVSVATSTLVAAFYIGGYRAKRVKYE